MKIEILNEGDYYKIYESGYSWPMKNFRNHFESPFAFYDDDIEKLLSAKDWALFLKGKYVFNVTKSHLQLITGERLPHTRQELELYPS